MPTVLLIIGFRLHFYSREEKRIHIHITKGNATIKIWMDTFEIASSKGFGMKEKSLAIKLARKYEKEITQKWKEHFENKT